MVSYRFKHHVLLATKMLRTNLSARTLWDLRRAIVYLSGMARRWTYLMLWAHQPLRCRQRESEMLAMNGHTYLSHGTSMELPDHLIARKHNSEVVNTSVPHEVKYPRVPRQVQQSKRVHKAPKLPPRAVDRILQL
jgi:hypothetical protein